MSIIGAFDVVAGEDLTFPVSMSPTQSVVGWTVALYGTSARVDVSAIFPPATVPPPGLYLWPSVPTWAIVQPTAGVIPGQQPNLPTTGATTSLRRDNTLEAAGGGIVVVNDADGVFMVTIPRAITLALPPGTYYWQFWRVDPGYYRQYAEGSFLVHAGR